MDCYGSACSYIHRMTHSSKNHPKFLPNFHLVITLIVHKRYVHLLDHCNLHSKSLFYFICHINFFLLNVLNELRSCGPVFFYIFICKSYKIHSINPHLCTYMYQYPLHMHKDFIVGIRVISSLFFET